MSRKILFIGGTRLLGKRIVERFIEGRNFEVTVLSRRAVVYATGECNRVCADRSEGLRQLAGKEFDMIVDFIAYDDKAVKEVLDQLRFRKYIFVSTCWMTKLNKQFNADQFIAEVAPGALELLHPVTQNYLVNKRAAENYTHGNAPSGSFHILRLPIFWGKEDHTKRLEFYVSRLLDNTPIIMVNGGNNICQISYVEDLSDKVYRFFGKEPFVGNPIYEALPSRGRKVSEILRLVADSVGSSSELLGVDEKILREKFSEYLGEEPLWREEGIRVTGNNIYQMLGSQGDPEENWLPQLALYELGKKPLPGSLRSVEHKFVKALV